MSQELIIEFSGADQVSVNFGDAKSGWVLFANPLAEADHDRIRWYVETYGAQYLGEPDDDEAERVQARMKNIGKALFKAVFDHANTRGTVFRISKVQY